MQLEGRVALVTGGKRIGAVVAEDLARAGADVTVVYRTSRDEAEQAALAARATGRRALTLQADLREPQACARVVDETVAAHGRLDVLVNMASVYRAVPFAELTVEHWNDQLDTDLRASFLCAHAAAPHMRRAGGGHIVNVADWTPVSRRPRYHGYLAYYVAKAGVVALTEALALELAPDKILVNAVAPGPIVAPEGYTEAERAAVERATPLGRWGGEAEVAHVVRALVTGDFVTGETIRVDGGRHLQ